MPELNELIRAEAMALLHTVNRADMTNRERLQWLVNQGGVGPSAGLALAALAIHGIGKSLAPATGTEPVDPDVLYRENCVQSLFDVEWILIQMAMGAFSDGYTN